MVAEYLKGLARFIVRHLPYGTVFLDTRKTMNPLTLSMLFMQKVVGINRRAYWPMHFTSMVTHPENVYVGVDCCPGGSPGCYIQGNGKVYLGHYTQIGPNVGIISANHDPYDMRRHVPWVVKIGDYCWIGMNAVILPGVELGDFTIVGAGSVVKRSFPEGYAFVNGKPAELVKRLDRELFTRFTNEHEYHGYIKASDFGMFRRDHLNV